MLTKTITIVILFVILIVYLIGAFTIDLLDNDATQYFTIAMNMYESGNYMDVTWRPDYNYLDKPPLLFWLSSFSFSIFGLNHFAYRLPSILINLLGIFSTYKLGKKLYNEQVGLYSSKLRSCAIQEIEKTNMKSKKGIFLIYILVCIFVVFSKIRMSYKIK